MAHFAEIDLDNKILRIIVVHNNELLDENGNENETKGIEFCKNLFGGNWVQTSYNSTFRKNYAGIGYSYDSGRDAFIAPKPFESWVLNETTCKWEAPITMPTDENFYQWDEQNLSWQKK